MHKEVAGRRVPKWATDAASTVPLLTAVVVGSTYGFGSVIELGRLKSAGLPTADTFPLVPLPHLLALGIRNAFALLLILPFFLLLTWGLHAVTKLERRHPEVDWPSSRFRYLTVIVMSVAGALFVPWDIVVGACATAVVMFVLFGRAEVSLARVLVISYAVLVLWGMADALLYPRHLPKVDLVLTSGDSVHGELIVLTDTAYVVHTGGRVFRSVRADAVERSVMH